MNTKFRLAFCCAALLTLCAGGLKADTNAYMITLIEDIGQGYIGTVDLTTGAFSPHGSIYNLSGFYDLSGLGVADGTLYGDWGTELYSINPSNGRATPVGFDSSVNYAYFGSTTSGLYALGNIQGTNVWGTLFSIDPATGRATYIGQTGLPTGGWGNLSTNSSTLYFSQGANLYTIDTTTAVATLVGSTGGAQIGAMLWDGRTLYGGDDENSSAQLDTLDTIFGTATPALSSYSPYGAIVGLAPDPLPSSAVPEPSEAALLGLWAAALLAVGSLSRGVFSAPNSGVGKKQL